MPDSVRFREVDGGGLEDEVAIVVVGVGGRMWMWVGGLVTRRSCGGAQKGWFRGWSRAGNVLER